MILGGSLDKDLLFYNHNQHRLCKLSNILPITCDYNPISTLQFDKSANSEFQFLVNALSDNDVPLVKKLKVPLDIIKLIVLFTVSSFAVHTIYDNQYFEIQIDWKKGGVQN